MLSRLATAAAAFAILLSGTIWAHADVLITVNKTTQRLTVSVNGEPRYEWPVSTARWGYRTPNGTYRPERLERKWYSRKYDWSPMPYSIFFDGGYAIHGSYEISHIGRPASHGCIRLYPKNAAVLFALVKANINDTRIVVKGEGPSRWRGEARERSRREQRTVRERVRPRGDNSFDGFFNEAPDYYDRGAPAYDPPPRGYYTPREFQRW
jgi:hypothetical protein